MYKRQDLYSLLQYVFRLNKTADDSRRANIITDDLTGCLPAMIPDINNPDMGYRLMLFIIQRRHKDNPQLVRHRIVSFQASDCILPQDLIPLAQSIASFYSAKGFICLLYTSKKSIWDVHDKSSYYLMDCGRSTFT